MNFKGSVVAISLAVIFMTACNTNERKQTAPLNAERKPVEFTMPSMIVIQHEEDNYRINNPRELESLIIKANELSIEIAILPASDLRFIKTSGEETFIDQKSLAGINLILFNGAGIMLTNPDSEISGLFDVFYKKSSKTQNEDSGISGRNNQKKTTHKHSQSNGKSLKDNAVGFQSEISISGINEKNAEGITSDNSSTIQDVFPVIVTNPVLNSYLWPFSKLSVSLENDLFSNTDRYFTNGVRIRFSSPSLAFWRINNILPVSRKGSMEYNSIELNHEMYTPYTTKLPPVLKNDRPYASALYVRFVRKSENEEKGREQEASLDIGVIGKASLGGLLQRGVHAGLPDNDEPLGWETQIGNDLILNYRYMLTNHIHTEKHFHAYTVTSASLGTYNTSASTGIGFKIGTSPYFIPPLPKNFVEIEGQRKRKWIYMIDAAFISTVVGYNATLSGGLVNKNNIYVLEPEEIERLLFKAEAGFTLNYQNYGLRIAQHFTTNEFKRGKHHFWGEMGLSIGL